MASQDHAQTASAAQETAPREGDELRRLRKLARLTQAQVAREMGVSQQHVAALEGREGSPSMATITRFAVACGATAVLSFEPMWTPEVCAKLNEYQRQGHMHPFTCDSDRGDEAHRAYAAVNKDRDWGLLVATPYGWRCPVCDYTQRWAHDFMFKGALSDGAPSRPPETEDAVPGAQATEGTKT